MGDAAVATDPMTLFGRQAEAMERYAIGQLAGDLTPEQREIMGYLRRHARGVQTDVESWRKRSD